MHVNKLTIGEFLPKKLGLKKNVINAPKANVTRNAMLTKTETPCNFTSGLICTDRLIFLESPLCVGFFRSEF